MGFFHLFFLLCTTIRRKIRVIIDLFLSFAQHHSTKIYNRLSFNLSLCMTIRSKIRVLIICFLFVHNHLAKVKDHSYSLIYSFVNCANILFAIFVAVLPLYFVRSVSGSTAFIFMAVLLLYFVRYMHGYMNSEAITMA